MCSYGRIQAARILSNLHKRCLRNLLFSEAANGSCLFLLFLVCVLFCSHPCSPMGVAKAKCTTHSFPPQCCHRHHHHRWPGLCLCQCQTQSLQPLQQKEGQPPPPHQVSMAKTRRRSLIKLYALECTPKLGTSLHRL